MGRESSFGAGFGGAMGVILAVCVVFIGLPILMCGGCMVLGVGTVATTATVGAHAQQVFEEEERRLAAEKGKQVASVEPTEHMPSHFDLPTPSPDVEKADDQPKQPEPAQSLAPVPATPVKSESPDIRTTKTTQSPAAIAEGASKADELAAEAKLKNAKQFAKLANKSSYRKKLTEIVENWPETKSGKEAAKLLAELPADE